MPSVPAAAVMSFLKDTRGLLTWTTRDLAETLDIPVSEAAKVIPIMEMQGYVKAPQGTREWFTTPAGQTVSGSKQPHYTRERVEAALAALKERIAAARKDFKSPFKISAAVVFGDFLSDRPGDGIQRVTFEMGERCSVALERAVGKKRDSSLAHRGHQWYAILEQLDLATGRRSRLPQDLIHVGQVKVAETALGQRERLKKY